MKEETEIPSIKYRDIIFRNDRIIIGEKEILFDEIKDFSTQTLGVKYITHSIWILLISSFVFLKYTKIDYTIIASIGIPIFIGILIYEEIRTKKYILINMLDGTIHFIQTKGIKDRLNRLSYLQELWEKHREFKIKILNEWATTELENIKKMIDDKAVSRKWDTDKMKHIQKIRTFFMPE